MPRRSARWFCDAGGGGLVAAIARRAAAAAACPRSTPRSAPPRSCISISSTGGVTRRSTRHHQHQRSQAQSSTCPRWSAWPYTPPAALAAPHSRRRRGPLEGGDGEGGWRRAALTPTPIWGRRLTPKTPPLAPSDPYAASTGERIELRRRVLADGRAARALPYSTSTCPPSSLW